MSWPLLPLGPSLLLTVVLSTIAAPLAIVFVNRLELERRTIVRLQGSVLFAAFWMVSAFAAWKSGVFPWAAWGVTIVWTALPVLGAIAASLPIALVVQTAPALIHGVYARLSRSKRESSDQSPKFSRRAALAIPLVAGGIAGHGFVNGVKPAKLRVFEIPSSALHSDLEGLRLLQLSDLHLGSGLDGRELSELIGRLAASRPDLVLLTGDVADTTAALEEGLALIETLRPPHGIFAVLGNHEYLSQRVDEMRAIYERSRVRLLVNEIASVGIGRAKLALIGVDDPLGTPEPDFENTIVELAVEARRSRSDYRVLLSHRPSGFEHAARAGIELTLSGHTHGGQAGWFGRSWAELVGLANWVWGFYRSERSLLYTTSGAGDWFPFRVNCPREAPLFVFTPNPRRDRRPDSP